MNHELADTEKIKIPIIKRAFDVIISSLLLIISLPLIIFILLLMLVESILIPTSRGNIFYTETRISQGKPFKIYKFRIFKKEILERKAKNEEFIHTKNLEKDKNNLTYMGKLLKQIYMDELPQLINVLRGDISLVGPRPTNVENYKLLLERKDYTRTIIKAGITGKFQVYKGVKYKYNQQTEDMSYINYCKNNPSWKVVLYDTKILLLTIITILKAKGI